MVQLAAESHHAGEKALGHGLWPLYLALRFSAAGRFDWLISFGPCAMARHVRAPTALQTRDSSTPSPLGDGVDAVFVTIAICGGARSDFFASQPSLSFVRMR